MYAIYMDRHASHRAIARCFGLGFFIIWHFASHTDTLPIPPSSFTGIPLLSYNIWQGANNSWQAAKSTPLDPLWSWSEPYLTSVPKIGPPQKKAFFVDFWPWTLTLGHKKISLLPMRPIFMPNIEVLGQTLPPFKGCETCGSEVEAHFIVSCKQTIISHVVLLPM